jgi:hypothetical protein
MRRSTNLLLHGGLAAISLLALSACVEGTTSSSTAATPTEAMGTTEPTPATPGNATPPAATTAPISPHPTTTAVAPVATAPTPAATPTAPATATAPTTIPSTGPAAGSSLLGTWESASCGGRAYPRHITFADATSFTAEDLVSPCPKGTTCVWSGIINRSGIYKVEKDVIALTVSKTGNGPAKTPFPTSLTLDAGRAPVEAGSDGKPCAYKHAGSDRKP